MAKMKRPPPNRLADSFLGADRQLLGARARSLMRRPKKAVRQRPIDGRLSGQLAALEADRARRAADLRARDSAMICNFGFDIVLEDRGS